WVILTGEFAYKIKKPVKLSFLDFSTLENRKSFCEEEVRLNRRLAPTVYLGVVPLCGSPSAPKVGGSGKAFEYAVHMRQFDSSQEFPELLKRGEIDVRLLGNLAERLAGFHGDIAVAGPETFYGSPDVIWKPVAECLEEMPLEWLPADLTESYEDLGRWCHREWVSLQPQFLKRKEDGSIRECHGDLHLRNIAVAEGAVCIFDALEFEPRLRWIDVISEVAFLVMDFEVHGRSDLAYNVLNRYLEKTGDYEGMRIFRFYEVYRALVRAKVTGLRLGQMSRTHPDWAGYFDEWIGYLKLAIRLRQERTAGIVLTHGVSGTGKTTVSSKLLQALCAMRIRSDVERRRIVARPSYGQETPDSYSPSMTQATYDRLAVLTESLVAAGFLTIVDATFLRRTDRQAFAQIASRRQIPFYIVDVTAPESVRSRRIERRREAETDASEATVSVMHKQVEQDEAFGNEEQSAVISIDSTREDSLQSAIQQLSRLLKVRPS
ncbi:MAG: AAA family ATPase, partial [Nitrospirales bacterium]|nr:AAA family ATPase [Nitrospirales bacterium]